MISRRDAPLWVKQTGRAVSRGAGRLTAGTRMLPGFLMVGTQRGGTTSLFRSLAEHPGIVQPNFHKGVHYFDVNYHRGPTWYQGHFPTRAAARKRAAGTTDRPLAFESAGYYMHHPLAPGRIAADLPGVKLIVLLRDPVERAYSAHKHELARGFETEPFERALELEPERLAGEVEKMRADDAYLSHSHRHHSYVNRGQYADQLEVLFELFGQDRVLVLFAEDFFAEPEPHYDRVIDFLGLPHWRPASFERHNARPSSPMPATVRARLSAHFEPYDEKLAALLGEVPAWRR
ncbi:Sulfotransferase domain-containing protein [Thermomonospora echinospora]|uniref:Sulfotransferase domain-containing protein n=1 Tax=Thermomonospora echinospora TaxID=1992 RepID=A0A1H6AEK9_9ACTN|nr:sulfotransferase domain-containing protein [Thermomonospora echinospora]SEG46822.1 Sulfotransferase domain-containing protein [Thermomonospora echinospora]